MTPRDTLKKRMTVGAAPVQSTEVKGKEAEELKQKRDDLEPRIPAYFGIFMAATTTFIVLYFVARGQQKESIGRVWVKEELARYDGYDEKLPLLLAFAGEVYDVSKGSQHYGLDESYHHFAAKDASRAFVTGEFKGGLTDDLSGLTHQQYDSVRTWRDFYKKTYTYVGRLAGRFYDVHGRPTREWSQLQANIEKATRALADQEALEKRFPSCNSRWSQAEGGQVWCESGFPRKVFRTASATSKGGGQMRCACFQESQLGAPDQRLYDDCHPTATTCITSPPEKASSSS
eukprot:jgi/Mesen1/7341/ME000377S06555